MKPLHIFAVSFAFYFIGLFAQSWYGLIIPIKKYAPQVWEALRLVKKVIVTSRDGLFEGFFFVSMGMCVAFGNFKFTKNKAKIYFILAMIAMFFEVTFFQYFGFIREHDMYFFLAPATLFFFCYIIQIDLPNSQAYKTMRAMSSLIFYSHLWVCVIVTKVLNLLFEPFSKSCLRFLLTLSITTIFSLVVIKLSEREHFRWLKVFYS